MSSAIKNNKTVDGKEIEIDGAIANGEYELGVLNRLNEISALTQRKEEDYSLLSGYVLGNAEADVMNFSLSQTLHDVVSQLQKIKSEMESEMTFDKFVDTLSMTATSSFQAGREGAVESFMAMIDPLTAAVLTLQDSVLTKMGIPEVPVIGNIQQILVKLGQIGRVAGRLTAQERDAARKEKEKETEEAGGSAMWRLYHDSVLEKIVNELVDTFSAVLDLIMKIIACIEPFLLMMLIDKLKPVIEYFGLALGEIYGIAENSVTIAKMVIFNQMKLLNLFGEAIRSKVEELWDVMSYFIQGGALPNDAMISAIARDIVSCDLDIEANSLDIGIIQANQSLYSKEKSLKELQDIDDKYGSLTLVEKLSTMFNLTKEINTLKTTTIPKKGKQIDKFNAAKAKLYEKKYIKLVADNLAKKAEIENALPTISAEV